MPRCRDRRVRKKKLQRRLKVRECLEYVKYIYWLDDKYARLGAKPPDTRQSIMDHYMKHQKKEKT